MLLMYKRYNLYRFFINLLLIYDYISYIIKYDLYKVKLLLLQLVVETSSHVALYAQVSSLYLNPKWIRNLCLCRVWYISASRILLSILLGQADDGFVIKAKI